MTVTINGLTTTDNYPQQGAGGTQIQPRTLAKQLDLTVGNAAVAIRLFTADPYLGALGGSQLTDEFVIVAGSGQIKDVSYKNCIGFQARSFKAGTPATIFATLWEKGDPDPLGGSSNVGTLTPSGSGPGGATVNIQHNGAAVGTEGTLDFEDSATVTWSPIADDPANSRVKATANAIIPSALWANKAFISGGSTVAISSTPTLLIATGTVTYSALLLRAHFSVRASDPSGSVHHYFLYDNGSLVTEMMQVDVSGSTNGAGGGHGASGMAIFFPAAGAHTYQLYASSFSGTPSLYGLMSLTIDQLNS